jgi:hypothetical protein
LGGETTDSRSAIFSQMHGRTLSLFTAAIWLGLETGMVGSRARSVLFVSGGLLVFVLSGCNSEKIPGLGQVTGVVTMDGKPLPDATLVFTPAEAGATASFGQTDASGKYELYYSRGHKGAKVGEHSVTINNFRDSGESGQGSKETIPAKYNVKTELKATVNRGANTIAFDLKGGGEIFQPNEEPGTGKKKGRSATGCF